MDDATLDAIEAAIKAGRMLPVEQMPALVAEVRRLREALDDAARLVRTLSSGPVGKNYASGRPPRRPFENHAGP